MQLDDIVNELMEDEVDAVVDERLNEAVKSYVEWYCGCDTEG